MSLNREVFFFLNGLAGRCAGLDAFWVFWAKYSVFVFGLAWVYYFRRDRELFFRLALALLITVVVVSALKNIWVFPRPFAQENVRLLIAHHADSAFPSKHSSAAFAIAFGIFLRKKRTGMIFLALASLVAVSRVVAGVHYPLDVLTGAVLGIIISSAAHRFLPYKKIS